MLLAEPRTVMLLPLAILLLHSPTITNGHEESQETQVEDNCPAVFETFHSVRGKRAFRNPSLPKARRNFPHHESSMTDAFLCRN
jgi:hypothetical protein